MRAASQLRFLRRIMLPVLICALAIGAQSVSAAFTGTTTNANTFAAAATFPTYPTSVTGDTPWAYHRSDDAVSSSATSTANDTTANNRDGTYSGLTNGASMYWDFDEGAGTTAADSSGAINTGTLSGTGATWNATGKVSNSLTFNGSSGYVNAAGPTVATNASFTISAWAYVTALPTVENKVVVSQTGSTVAAFVLLLATDGTWGWGLPRTDSTSPTYDWTGSGTTATLNTWNHVVGVYDSSAGAGLQMKLYVNAGTATTAGHTSTWSATGKLEVGRALYNSAYVNYFAGRIDEVRTYRRALSAAEISSLKTSPATVAASMTAALPGALQGAQQGQTASTAVAFNGTSNAYNNTSVVMTGSQATTLECWFKTTTTTGGALIGFTNNQTGSTSANKDRIIYLDDTGKLHFHVHPATNKNIVSTAAYNDGSWHHVAASVGASGQKLYVDGSLAASDLSTTTGDAFTGYWRWGGLDVNLSSGTLPTTYFLTGTLDEVAIYTTQLTDQQIAWHYYANH